MILRDYQLRAVEDARAQYRLGKRRIVMMLPTGSGKTVIAASMIRSATDKGTRTLFLVHRRELVLQAAERLRAWGVEPGIIAAGTPEHRDRPCQVASIQTLARRERPDAGLVFVDECQHARAQTWSDLLDLYRGSCVVGLSATPYRLDGLGLGALFESIVQPISVLELCESGVLVAPRVLAPPGPDLSGVRKVHGEYDLVQLSEVMEKLCGNTVEHWLKHGSGRKTVGFAVNIAHSCELVRRFQAAGVRAAHVDGGTSREERDSVLAQLRDGALDVVWNCMILGEGWDLPALSCAVLARPTASMALHRQQIGRIMRAADGKGEALVLDHAGNTHRHGLVTDHIDVSLADRAKRTVSPFKTCPKCFCVVAIGESVCPECGHVWTVERAEENDKTEETDGQLVEFTRASRREFYLGLVTEASARSRRLGWARYKFKEKFGAWPSSAGALGRKVQGEIEDGYTCPGYEGKASEWGERCGWCCRARSDHAAAVTSAVTPAVAHQWEV